MNQQLSNLLQRYQRVTSNASKIDPSLIENFNTLRLADATLDKLALNKSAPEHPTQIVILGPTQAGKSTLCNLILDTNQAGISSLAGYTVHAQGFAQNCEEHELQAIETLLLPHERVAFDQLDHDNLNQFVLQSTQTGANALIDKGVVWDSPDFDSVDSAGYRNAVLQAAAVADVLILMVSKDKYADKTVWNMLELLRSLGKPLFVCINKLDERDEATVFNSLTKRYEETFNDTAPALLSIPFIKQSSENKQATENTIDIGNKKRQEIAALLAQSITNSDRASQEKYAYNYIESQWSKWIEPLLAESQAQKSWTETVDQSIQDAKALYVSRYLDNPQKYATFNKAVAELLTFLEIPGLAGALSTTRNLVTWPVRKLFKMGKDTTTGSAPTEDQELEMLALILDRTSTRLNGFILDQQQDNEEQQDWWRALGKQFKTKKPVLTEHYTFTAKQLQTEFEPKIEDAAKQLYEQLQEQPILLNSLRAARATTDAGAVVLAVKSGGLAAADLIIAPAMLSVTSLLTESVLGKYMDRIKQQLKDEQEVQVNSQLFDAVLKERLLKLSSSIDNSKLLLGGDEFDFELTKA